MPYVKRTTKAGKTIEIEYYYTSQYNRKGRTKRDKVKATEEAQKRINTKQAERKIRLLMNNNFGYGDFHLVLDYIRHKGEQDRTPEQMKKDIQIFLRECRKEYRKHGLEFRYIHVMEIGKRGARHHHLVVNHIDPQILQKAWYKAYEGHNRVKIFPLDDSGQYGKLASYFIKYTSEHLRDENGKRLQGKRWNASKNLVMPEPDYEIITDRAWYRCEARAPKGYYIEKDSIEKGIVSPEYYGYGYYRYRLVQLDDMQEKRSRKRGEKNKCVT